MEVNLKRLIKICLFQKVGVAKKIGCKNDIVLSKIVQKKYSPEWMGRWMGWLGGWKSCFKDFLQQSIIRKKN